MVGPRRDGPDLGNALHLRGGAALDVEPELDRRLPEPDPVLAEGHAPVRGLDLQPHRAFRACREGPVRVESRRDRHDVRRRRVDLARRPGQAHARPRGAHGQLGLRNTLGAGAAAAAVARRDVQSRDARRRGPELERGPQGSLDGPRRAAQAHLGGGRRQDFDARRRRRQAQRTFFGCDAHVEEARVRVAHRYACPDARPGRGPVRVRGDRRRGAVYC
mmetsp:Transcript_11600/g.34459  ORF Transcript_11600/g.34459 Transcript_11600/m.34459 type:complete len:218 (-) Transcript_11600:5064-5717(-)